MKKAFILFLIVLLMTAVIPIIAVVQSNRQAQDGNELVTIFSSCVSDSSRPSPP